MKIRFHYSLMFLAFLFGAGSLFAQQTSIVQSGCLIIGETSLDGSTTGCVDSQGNSPNITNNYEWELQRLSGGSFTTVDFQATSDPLVEFTNPGGGTYRIRVRAFERNGVIATQPVGQLCSFMVETFDNSSNLSVSTTYSWVSYPLGWGTNAGSYMDTRDASNDGKVYYTSHGRMWNYYYSGGSWKKAPLSWGTRNVAGPIFAEPGGGSKVYYRGSDSRMYVFEFSNGSWSSSGLNNSFTNVRSGGQIASHPGKVYYTGTDGKIWNFYAPGGNWTAGDLFSTTFFLTEHDNATGPLVLLEPGWVVYRNGDQELVSYRFRAACSCWSRADIPGAVGVANSDLATTGNRDIWYRTNNNEMKRAQWDGSAFNVTGFIGQDNVAGDITATPDSPTHVYYRGTDGRMWQYYRKSNGIWSQVTLDYSQTNVKGPASATPGKVFYRSSNNDIWNVYWATCGSKQGNDEATDQPLVSDVNSLEVYPNPAQDFAYVQVELANEASIDLAIFDMMGKKVMDLSRGEQLPVGTSELSVSIESLPKGMYFVRLTSGQDKLVKRLIVQ